MPDEKVKIVFTSEELEKLKKSGLNSLLFIIGLRI